MKIILFSRPQIAHKAEDVGHLLPLVERYGFDYAINQEFAVEVEKLLGVTIPSDKIYAATTGQQPADSVMVCFGGDGTLLEGIHRLSDRSIPVAGVNFGHLGFLTSATREGVERLFDDIANNRLKIQPRTMLEIDGISEAGRTVSALNEVAAHRLEATMIKVEARVNSQRVAQYNGDGVIVSTPTGSTAYSLSAGGPIIYPQADVFVLTAVAPHSLGVRPIVIPDDKTISLSVESRNGSYLVAIDGISQSYPEHTTLTLRKAKHTIRVVKKEGNTFFHTLHEKMMWGADPRK